MYQIRQHGLLFLLWPCRNSCRPDEARAPLCLYPRQQRWHTLLLFAFLFCTASFALPRCSPPLLRSFFALSFSAFHSWHSYFFFLFFFSFLCSLVFALLLMHSSCALLFCFALLFLLCRASFFCTRLCTRFCVSSFLQLLSFAFLFCTPLYLRTRRSFAPRADPLPSPALHPHHHHHHHPHPQRHPGLQ